MPVNPKLNHFVLSDLHLGHEPILKFCRPWFKTIDEHDQYIIDQINKTCTSQDYLWLLGDVAFSRNALMKLKDVKVPMALIGGNHDTLPADTYLRVFQQVRGVAQMGKVLFTHIPMHPEQMRWEYNIHGHLHTYHVGDARYINVSCEPLEFTPKRISELISTP
jgi:calcineurin-like phosphoesterase family protein